MPLKTRTQIALEYNIDRDTLRKMLKEANLNIPERRNLSPKHIRAIYEELGDPSEFKNF
jgi:hypothetical protein